MDEKDSTIAKLKENLIYAATDKVADGLNPDKKITNINNNNNVGIEIERLIRDIDRRDEIIAELQTKLSQAVVEINESSLLIEKFRSDRSSGRLLVYIRLPITLVLTISSYNFFSNHYSSLSLFFFCH